MFNENKKDRIIEEVLNSLDGIQRATPAPFFYTRLNARLARTDKNVWEKVTSFVSRPVVAFAMVTAIIVLNMTVLYNKTAVSTTNEPSYQAVYEDYSLASTDFYDFEIKEP